MTPDAGYWKGSSIWRDLADVKALCAVRAVDEPVLKNLAGMQGKVSRPSYKVGKGFTLPDNGSGKRFKIHYVLFEVSRTYAVVCLPYTSPVKLPLPEDDEQDDATNGENGSGGGSGAD